jgi:aerobic-type carbon monoxide dehydrogenase small subunit (CoxS/CutS family)
MAVFDLNVNGESRTVDVPPDTPLLWVLRDELGLTGTKYSCGISLCGACAVDIDGSPVRTCSTPVTEAVGRRIRTIEGLSSDGSHPVQKAWVAEQVPQCGFCQSGLIMAAALLLDRNPHPSDDEIEQWMNSYLCRCGTYSRIHSAIRQAEKEVTDER